MNAFERKIALRVLGIHGMIILGLLILTGLKSCLRPKPRPEIVTFIEFGQPAPPVEIVQVAAMSEPQPPEPSAPDPEPMPAPIPEPVKKPIAKPQPAPKPKPTPRPKEPEKPKWKPVDPKDIKIGKKINETAPSKPTLTERDIAKTLSGIQRSSSQSGPTGNPDAIAAYDAHIYQVFYNAWDRPAAPASRPAKVTLSISSSGRVLASELSQSSGDTQFDATVMNAVRSVNILPRKPPAGYPLNNIVVQFRIVD